MRRDGIRQNLENLVERPRVSSDFDRKDPEDSPEENSFAARESTDATEDTNPYESTSDSVPTPASMPRYVRRSTPHKTQPPVNDLAQDDVIQQERSHDSKYSVSKSPISGRGYRRSRSDMPNVKKELKYGQYLEVPKGGRSIFESRSQRRHRQQITIGVAVVAAVIIAIVLWIALH